MAEMKATLAQIVSHPHVYPAPEALSDAAQNRSPLSYTCHCDRRALFAGAGLSLLYTAVAQAEIRATAAMLFQPYSLLHQGSIVSFVCV